jgi:hypothetical protein
MILRPIGLPSRNYPGVLVAVEEHGPNHEFEDENNEVEVDDQADRDVRVRRAITAVPCRPTCT